MDPLELVRSRNRADVSLPSGLGATIGLVRMQDAVGAGMVPLSVLREMDRLAKAEEETPDPPPEVMEAGLRLRREMVRRTLKRLAPSLGELNGQPEVDMPAEVVDELSQDDFDYIAGFAMRDTPFPAAGSPA